MNTPTSTQELPDVIGHGETILVVDDDAQTRNLVAKILRRRGYETIEAADGDAALHALAYAPTPVDLLLTDFIMPKVSGAPLARALHEWYPCIRVLMMSGYADVATQVCNEMLPGTRVIAKPFDGVTLARLVSEALAS